MGKGSQKHPSATQSFPNGRLSRERKEVDMTMRLYGARYYEEANLQGINFMNDADIQAKCIFLAIRNRF